MNELVRYDAMVRAIAECHRVDEVKDLHDKALALEIYMKQARNVEAERLAAAVRMRAERRSGEMLAAMKRTPAGDRKSAESVSNDGTLIDRSEYAETLNRTGITRQTAHRWQKLAEVPAEEFEAAMSDKTKKPSTVVLLAKRKTGVPLVKPKRTKAADRVRARLDEAPKSMLGAAIRQVLILLRARPDLTEQDAMLICELADEVSAAVELVRARQIQAA